MDRLKMETEDSGLQQTPRTWIIELLQVSSLLALAAFFVLPRTGASYRGALLVLSGILFVTPFLLVLLVKPPAIQQAPDSRLGFRITHNRIWTLEALSVPPDILQAIDKRFIDIHFAKSEDLCEALYFVLGEARVKPWMDTILLHARVYRNPAANSDKKAEPSGPVGTVKVQNAAPKVEKTELERVCEPEQ
jgi:hypothetical protein